MSVSKTLRDGNRVYRVAGIHGLIFDHVTLKKNGKPVNSACTGDQLIIEMEVKAERSGQFVCAYWIHFFSTDGKRVARIESPPDTFNLKEGENHFVRIDVSPLLLASGEYLISFSAFDISSGSAADTLNTRYEMLSRSYHLVVNSGYDSDGPIFYHPSEWVFEN